MISASNRRGYTLLEIGLAMGIIALVFVAAVPVTEGFLVERRLRGASDQITDLAVETRLAARREGNFLSVVFRGNELGRAGEDAESLPPGIVLLVRDKQGKWTKPDNVKWMFAPSGLVEPWTVRLEMGRHWLEADYDVLTAMVTDERYSF